MVTLGWILLLILLFFALSFNRASLIVATIGFFAYLFFLSISHYFSVFCTHICDIVLQLF